MKLIKNISLYILVASFAAFSAFSKSSFSGERLEKACTDYVINNAGDVEVEVIQKIKDKNFDEDGVSAFCKADKSKLKGVTSVTIEFRKNGELLAKETARVRVKLFKTMPVASQTLRSGSVITDGDIVNERTEITSLEEKDIIDSYSLIGRKLKRGAVKGVAITFKDLETEKLVKKGDKIEIIAVSGAVSVKTTGFALQDGAVGDMIRIKRESSGAGILSGVVSENGAVIIGNESQRNYPNGR